MSSVHKIQVHWNVLCFRDTLCTFPILCVMPVTVIAKSVPIILICSHSDIDGRHNLPCSENSHSLPFWILYSWNSFCTVYISSWEFEPTRCSENSSLPFWILHRINHLYCLYFSLETTTRYSENSRSLLFHFAFCTALTFCIIWTSDWGFEPTRWQTKCV